MRAQLIDRETAKRTARPVTVAYVDDSEDDLFLASEALRATGRAYELRSMGSAVEMWFMLNERMVAGDDLPDVLVMDLKMPRVDGHQLLDALLSDEVVNTVPMCVLTTSSDRTDMERVAAAGPVRYLVKPSKFDQLVDTFDLVLDIGRGS